MNGRKGKRMGGCDEGNRAKKAARHKRKKNNTYSEGETEKGREEEVNDLKAGLLNEVDMREKKEVKKLIH